MGSPSCSTCCAELYLLKSHSVVQVKTIKRLLPRNLDNGNEKDLAELEFEVKLPQKDWMSKVVCNARGDKHLTELNHTQWVEGNKIEPK